MNARLWKLSYKACVVPWGILEMYRDILSWKSQERHGISAVIQEKSDQETEDEPGSCWSLGGLDHRECGGGTTWDNPQLVNVGSRKNHKLFSLSE